MNFSSINTQSPEVPMRNMYLFKQSDLKFHEKLKVDIFLFIAIPLGNANAILLSPEDLFQIHITAYSSCLYRYFKKSRSNTLQVIPKCRSGKNEVYLGMGHLLQTISVVHFRCSFSLFHWLQKYVLQFAEFCHFHNISWCSCDKKSCHEARGGCSSMFPTVICVTRRKQMSMQNYLLHILLHLNIHLHLNLYFHL